MFSVGVFSHMLQIDDALIGVMSCISKILAGFVYAFATTDFVFYLGQYFRKSTPTPVVRGQIEKNN